MREDGQRGVEAVRSPRSVVQAVGDGIEFVLAVDAQVRALGQVLAQKAVGVLAGTALPGAVRIAEVHPHPGVQRQLLMPAHLLALVVGEAVAHRCGNRIELDGEARQRRSGGGVLHAGQQQRGCSARATARTPQRSPTSIGREFARTTLTGKDIKLRSGGDMTLSAIEASADRLDLRAYIGPRYKNPIPSVWHRNR